MFELETAIKNWKKSLRKNEALEEGYIAELESHLRDVVEEGKRVGKTEEVSFNDAVKTIGSANALGEEYYKTDTTHLSKRPPWKESRFVPSLLFNYLKVARRNIFRQKGYSFINIIGLALGISIFFLIIQYVSFELSYDRFHKNADLIYRVRNDRVYSDKHDKSAGCPPALAPLLEKEFPEIIESARLKGTSAVYIDDENKTVQGIEKIYFAEKSFLKIFSFPMLEGSSESALEEPNSVVISKNIAQKYFADKSPVNKIITLVTEYGKQSFKVTGLLDDIPQNSHIKFDVLISYKTLAAYDKRADYYVGWNAFNTYILLAPGASPKVLEAKLPDLVRKYNFSENSYKRNFLLQPLTDIHLYSDLRFEPEVNGSSEKVKFLSIIAAFVLILSWVNYINLSTSRSLMRAKEVGIRKVLGSNRFQLMKQFMMESFLLNLLALILAVTINIIALPYFNQLTGKPLTIGLLLNYWPLLVSVFIAGAFSASIYPTVVLSSFNPFTVLKTRMGRITSGIDLRKGLVIFQFAVSIILIASTIIIYEQLSYLRNGNLGVNIDQILVLKAPASGHSYSEATSFKDALSALPGIKGVSVSSSIPGKSYSNTSSGVRKYGSGKENGTQGFFIDVDENYFNLFEVPLLAGRHFNRESRLNGEIIINEEAVKVYGFKNSEDAINKKLVFDGFDGQSIEIVGVTKNYHIESMKSNLLPVVFNPVKADDVKSTKYYSVKIDGSNIKQIVERIKAKWMDMLPNQPFEYSFLDEMFDSQYKAEQEFGKVFGIFAFLAIIISCLGLFGLASYTNIQRTKEIGIRKVVGASLQNIVVMLIKDFGKWVLLANIIAWPAAYFIMKTWLNNFAYRIDISWWIFILSGGIALIIALTTIGYQAVKAATANPVISLRNE